MQRRTPKDARARPPEARRRRLPIRFAGLAATLLGAVVLALTATGPAGAQEDGGQVPPIDVIEVNGLVDEIVVSFVERSVDKAEESGVQALVLQVNTKKSVVSDATMARLAQRLAQADVPIGVWVGPSGARAYGRPGQLVTVADFAGVAPGARVGNFGRPLLVDGERLDFDEDLIRGSLGAAEALDAGIATVDAPVLGDLIVGVHEQVIDGREMRTARVVQGEDRLTREPIAQVRFAKLGVIDQLFHTVASPPVAYLLFLAGLSLLLFEFFTAGVGVAGVVGAGSLILACYGLDVLPARAWALALLVVAIFGFGVDVQTGVPRVWSAIGVVCLVIGSLALYDGVSLSWVAIAFGIGGTTLAMLGGMPTMVRTRFATPTIGREWMVGEIGQVVESADPDGVVEIGSALWRARTNRATPVEAGQPVRVVAIDGIVLEVEPLEGAARDHRARGRKP